ncbi:3-dehydro-L-gulonate-6-phosphate decarboxylase [Limosilactobacillus coleohominis 101-4-CHN]|uniref:3-hexulose-6-phosphate synthase n=1 Tax=Limosilactobacillus coleohominis 101-4-CHN TaxID=575594 RepID=C7XVB9_9LACO|nr:3-keto-L-gulonate-6-phosphate decarboxylase UlaD [Limosilactobacillus coleohominis]EEU30285.1 3-dehydro-L-gulonate-6-phosphate decarboxylase [Limosilactobacillus coleohominis 101-4-CHN]
MTKPMLQVALDTDTTAQALNVARQVSDVVDVVEAGTLLIYQEGMDAVSDLRAIAPDKIVLADAKCADAGGHIGKVAKKHGADWLTCINAATVPTMANAQKEIEVQVELYEGWDNKERAQEWLDNGIDQVVYHQSRDAKFAGQTWGEKDLNSVKSLIDMGFKVSVTGGVKPEVLKLFKGLPVYCFIAGRAIHGADDPHAAALEFKNEIDRIWG